VCHVCIQVLILYTARPYHARWSCLVFLPTELPVSSGKYSCELVEHSKVVRQSCKQAQNIYIPFKLQCPVIVQSSRSSSLLVHCLPIHGSHADVVSEQTVHKVR
jgi:hypothetical protein